MSKSKYSPGDVIVAGDTRLKLIQLVKYHDDDKNAPGLRRGDVMWRVEYLDAF